MNYQEDKLNGYLISETKQIPVEIIYASRYSLFVKLPENEIIRDGTSFEKLKVSILDVDYEFNSCKIMLEANISGFTGRLLFVNNIYDFNSLFFKKQFINLESMSNNLEYIINQKKKIKRNFKNYVSNVTYDLKVYKNYFDGIDKSLENEPDLVRNEILETILNTDGRSFMGFMDSILDNLRNITEDFSREEHEIHGFHLRKHLWDIILCSDFMSRTNMKPRGYAGDSEMMKMIYENAYRGDSTFSKILYKYSLEHPASQAVRNRRVMIPKILHEVQKEFSKKNGNNCKIKFLSVACGPAFELQDLFITERDIANFEVTLLDQDFDALYEAVENIKEIEKRLGYKLKVDYLKDSVRTMLRTKDLSERWGKYNMIYSMGLFDYLTQPVAKAVINKLYQLLEPGGKILLGNFHYRNPSKIFLEYWHDWVLYYRDENEFISLLKDTDAVDRSVIFENTGSQMFLVARKPY